MSLQPLKPCYLNEDSEMFEIGVDEAGRGPLFGRVYAAAVILPKTDQIQIETTTEKEKKGTKRNENEIRNRIRKQCPSNSE